VIEEELGLDFDRIEEFMYVEYFSLRVVKVYGIGSTCGLPVL
jgi:hypothetical protein